ncbi:MAG: DUF4197 family protein, partial [Rickettsiales bacterium]|nr:DUF4197 family protein [Rickettsiales bacterium]
MAFKKITAFIILITTIFGIASCSYIKGEAKSIASERLRKYTKDGIEKLLASGTKIGLPYDIEKILPLLKQFGLKTSSTNISEEITKLSDKAIKITEPVLFLAIDEMSLTDAIRLMTSSKKDAP